MTSLTLPTSSVANGSDAKSIAARASVLLAEGQIVYRVTATKKMALARCDVAATKVAVGMCRQSVAADGPLEIVYSGTVTTSGLAAGTFYCLSKTVAGGIMPIADLVSGDNFILIGYAPTTTSLILMIKDLGTKP